VPVQAQVARALLLLVSRHGSLVLREELVRHLWPDTVVEYDQGLNNIIRMLRRSLGHDAARQLRIVRTQPAASNRRRPSRGRNSAPELLNVFGNMRNLPERFIDGMQHLYRRRHALRGARPTRRKFTQPLSFSVTERNGAVHAEVQ